MSDSLLLFLIANSIFINIFPFVYLHTTYDSLSEEEKVSSPLSLSSLFILISVSMGLLFPLIYSLIQFIPRKVSGIYIRFNIAGALSAVIISVILDHFLHLYDIWFEEENPLLIHLGVFIFYFCIYQVLGIWLYKRIAGIFAIRYSTPSQRSSSNNSPSIDSISSRLSQYSSKKSNGSESSNSNESNNSKASSGSGSSSGSSSKSQTEAVVDKYFNTTNKPNNSK